MVLSRLIPSFLLITACLNLAGCAQTSTGVQTQQLLKTAHAWEGTRYDAYPQGRPELSVLKITIPAKTTLNWHTHPMPNAAYVVSGELLVETREGKRTRLTPGQVLPEVVNVAHRGISANTPVELIVFYAGATDLPLSTPD